MAKWIVQFSLSAYDEVVVEADTREEAMDTIEGPSDHVISKILDGSMNFDVEADDATLEK